MALRPKKKQGSDDDLDSFFSEEEEKSYKRLENTGKNKDNKTEQKIPKQMEKGKLKAPPKENPPRDVSQQQDRNPSKTTIPPRKDNIPQNDSAPKDNKNLQNDDNNDEAEKLRKSM
jgi:hypothetical protein